MRGATTKERDIIQTGMEPEFVVSEILYWEDAGDGLIRIFCGSRHGTKTRVEYSFVCMPRRLIEMCKKGCIIAAEAIRALGLRAH